MQQSNKELLNKIERLEQELSYEKRLNQKSEITISDSGEYKLLRALIDNLPHGIYVKDKDSRFILANQFSADVKGIASPNELIGKTDFDFFPPDQADESLRDEIAIMTTGKPIINKEEEKFYALTNQTRLHLTTKVPYRDKENNIIGIVGISRDITELKQIREELQEANKKLEADIVARTQELESEVQERIQTQDQLINERNLLRLLIDNMPDVIYVKDRDSRFILANQCAATCMGVQSPEDLIGKTDLDFYPDEYGKLYYADEQEVIQTGEPLINKEEPSFNHFTGEKTWNLATKVPYTDQDGNIIGLVGITRNISEQKLMQDNQLKLAVQQERIRMLESFISDFSHDFKTPLSIINTNLYLLRNHTDEERYYNRINRIEWQVSRLENMIEAILILSRLDVMVDLDPSLTNIPLLVTQILSAHQIAITQKNIRLITKQSTLPPIPLEHDIVKYALDNIIMNAIQYTPDGGLINICTQHQGQTIQIKIIDTGIGIDEDEIPKIFDRFYRVDMARNSENAGAGLGLAIARKAIELHQGTIEVTSKLGEGSCFLITLPIADV